jgi:glutamyl-tRNA synthetase
VRVAAGEHVDAGAAEQVLDLGVRRVRQQYIVVGVRRAVERAQGHAVVQLDVKGRHERSNLIEVARLELRQRPLALVEVSLRERFRRVGRHLEQKGICVSKDDRPAQRGETVEDFPRLVATLHRVAEADHAVDAELLELRDDRCERVVRAVDVGYERERHRNYDRRPMSVRAQQVKVRMAPSPTGYLHIGGVRTFLFNWLFARHHGGEFRLRIENTDTSREVAEAVDQIQASLRWLGLDWDGPVTFQLDRLDDCRRVADQLVAEGKAYEDDGATRFRMPNEGVTAWDDVVRGRVEFPNEKLEDVVLVRGDGRPTYNFASPMEDVWDEITHVIRAEDHISNTPKQINIIQAVGADLPVYAHVPNVNGEDGKKLSKRHGATGVDEFRKSGYLPDALVNFLALLGWAPDGETTIMSRTELIDRFSLERVTPSPAQFDYAKLDWMNGMYIRALSEEEFADALILWLGEQGFEWDAVLVRKAAPLVQEKLSRLEEFPVYARFLFEDVRPDPTELDGGVPVIAAARDALAGLEPFTAESIEAALRAVVEQLGLKPRQGFQPIRIAVTGSKVSPGLFESIELLGREATLARLSAAAS